MMVNICDRSSKNGQDFNLTTFPVANVVLQQPDISSNTSLALDYEDGIIRDEEEERYKLRITSSLMDVDESSDSDNDGEEEAATTTRKEDIFRSQNNFPPTDKSSHVTLESWNSINLLDEESQSRAEIHKTYSDKFNSVYDEVSAAAAAKNKKASTSNYNRNRFKNARTCLGTAVISFGAGLSKGTACDAVGTTFPMVATTWDVDVDGSSQLSGEKRISEKRFSLGEYHKRRKPFDIRSELVLMQDKMDQYERTIQSLERENAHLTQAKSNLQFMLEQSKKAVQTAQLDSKISKNCADSLTLQLNEMKNELQGARRDVLSIRKENDDAKEAVKDRMRNMESEIKAIMKKKHDKYHLELASLTSQVTSAERTVTEYREVIERQADKIVKLECTLAETTTAATDALEKTKEAEEERNFWKSRAMLSPKAKKLAKSFVHTSGYYNCEQQKLPRTRSMSIGKENIENISGCCSLCFKKQNGVSRWCKCGKADCNKWCHSKCLATRKSNASTSVSHPGTPPPVLPLILCSGIEPVIRK